jgi:tRNA(Ile2) C34 agmatinyltransferase TiaS
MGCCNGNRKTIKCPKCGHSMADGKEYLRCRHCNLIQRKTNDLSIKKA